MQHCTVNISDKKYALSCMTHFGYFWPLGWIYFTNPIAQASREQNKYHCKKKYMVGRYGGI